VAQVPTKFTITDDMGGYALHIDTEQTNIEIGATERELRRLLIDLAAEFDVPDPDA
jgi:hypothetical protein